jgi:SAM-dependent methyltransferase
VSGDYHGTRLAEDARRGAVWRALWRYHFRQQVRPDDCVLDLGAGYGDFINSVTAARRIAIDLWPDMPRHLASGVEGIVGPADGLDAIGDGAVDYAFSSNLFEHLTQDEVASVLTVLQRVLSPRGQLTLLQPNYRYAAREYWDDYTHVTAWSHVSLPDFLRAHGWEVTDVRPRFLPLSVKSRLPTWPILIAAWLASPWKPIGKQMLIVARPKA